MIRGRALAKPAHRIKETRLARGLKVSRDPEIVAKLDDFVGL